MPHELIAILAILFLASLIRSVFGFADALIAMPLLTLVIGLRSAAPLVALMSAVNATTILMMHWQHLQIKSAWRLIISTLAGIPIGLYLLKGAHEPLMRIILAAVLILFSLFQLLHPRVIALKSDGSAFAFGFSAGILGGAYNTNGPPVVMYATLRQWTPESFRATLNGYFLLTGFMILAGHATAGLWTPFVLTRFLYALPVFALAHCIGHRLHKKLPRQSFSRYIYLLLLAIGLYLCMQTVFTRL